MKGYICHDIHHSGGGDSKTRSSLLLTGGSSRRMGFDKASFLIDGEPLGHRLARLLRASGWEPTVLGQSPIEGFAFKQDSERGAGPLAALREFHPTTDFIFLLSCDVPCFDPVLCEVLLEQLGEESAVIPQLDGRLQPLCALYHRNAWQILGAVQSNRVLDWIDRLETRTVDKAQIEALGVRPSAYTSANTPEELEALLSIQNKL